LGVGGRRRGKGNRFGGAKKDFGGALLRLREEKSGDTLAGC